MNRETAIQLASLAIWLIPAVLVTVWLASPWLAAAWLAASGIGMTVGGFVLWG